MARKQTAGGDPRHRKLRQKPKQVASPVRASRNRIPARKRPERARSRPVPEITLAELMRRLADPDVPEGDIRPYVTLVRHPRGRTEPLLLPNDRVNAQATPEARARGDIGLGFLNEIWKARRRRRFEWRLATGDTAPILIAEGDSWFQYPLFLEDVIDHLDDSYNVLCFSAAGDELRTMIERQEYRDYLDTLAEGQGIEFAAFLFSAGGNDLVGDTMRTFLRPFDAGQLPEWHLEPVLFARKTAEIVAGYETMIWHVRAFRPQLPILIHGYDYAIPLPDQGFSIPPRDGWLGEPMRAMGIPDGPIQAAIVHAIMDRLNIALLGLAGGNAGGTHPGVYFVDNRDTVLNRWADELHPTDAGFAEVSANFREILADAGT
jgi:hypothetical protein